jgi:hypothetical protein
MASKDQIKETILQVAGNPVSGSILELSEEMAEAIVALDHPRAKKSKEIRVLRADETR